MLLGLPSLTVLKLHVWKVCWALVQEVHISLFLNFFLFVVQEFDIATHLDTVPELVDRVYNRPTIATLQKETLKGATDPACLKVVCPATICIIVFLMFYIFQVISTKKDSLDRCGGEQSCFLVLEFLLVTQGCSGCHLIIKCLEPIVKSSPGLTWRTCSVVAQSTVDYKSRVVTYGPERNTVDMIRQFPWQNWYISAPLRDIHLWDYLFNRLLQF